MLIGMARKTSTQTKTITDALSEKHADRTKLICNDVLNNVAYIWQNL